MPAKGSREQKHMPPFKRENLSFHSYKGSKTNFVIGRGAAPTRRQPGGSFGLEKALVSSELLGKWRALVLEEGNVAEGRVTSLLSAGAA